MKYNLSKKEKITPVGPPCRKKLYDSKEAALEALEYISSTRHVRLKAYQCSVCGFWHLTRIKSA
jgi:hypothetical protein